MILYVSCLDIRPVYLLGNEITTITSSSSTSSSSSSSSSRNGSQGPQVCSRTWSTAVHEAAKVKTVTPF